MPFLPKNIKKIYVPPIKCQGIKTKLVRFIAENVYWNGEGKWIEPFLGSGVVLFNILPKRALVADTNVHIINFYRDLQSNRLDSKIVRDFLEEHGALLKEKGGKYYYELRERFNSSPSSNLFLFLNRAGFNGIQRFNSNGEMNVPYNHKDNRFSKSYITKTVNQVNQIQNLILDHEWKFIIADWKETYKYINPADFVYLDPPYIGRHTDYFNQWSEEDAVILANYTRKLECNFALSMWKENKYRVNKHLTKYWSGYTEKTFDHFYHVGSTENLRNKMIEALIVQSKLITEKKINITVDTFYEDGQHVTIFNPA